MRYIIGIDQGGSKTHGILANESGCILGLVQGPGLCSCTDPLSVVEDIVRQLLTEAGLDAGQIHSLVAGMSGIDWPGDEAAMEQSLRSRLGIGDVQAVNDCIIALHAGTSASQSAVICAGSGVNCAVRNDEELFTYGFYIPDEHQGGLALGQWAVQAVMDAQIGLTPETVLKAAVLEHLGDPSVDALLKRRSEHMITDREYLSLPPVLEKAALEGDSIALAIWRKYGKILADYVTTRVRLMGMEDSPVEVVLSGSIFKCRVPDFSATVEREILANVPNAVIVPSVFEPIVGAVVMGLQKLHGRLSRETEANLHRSAAEHCLQRMESSLPVIPDTEIYPTEEAMSLRCARLIRDCIAQKPDALICLAAGKTGLGTFEALVSMVRSGELDVSRTRFVSLDEWVGLSADALEEDCAHFLRRNVYGPLNISEERLFLFNPNAEDLLSECRRIDEVIFSNGGVDFMLLGLGMNGHLGLNEPGADFRQYSYVAALSDVTKSVGQKYFSQETALSGGITLGIQHMFEARDVVLQICGSHKQDIVHALYTTPATTNLPGTVFQLLPRGRIIMDEAAAAKIRHLL